jgi:hypothetical protein
MKKLYLLAALLMATTSAAHAGGRAISFQIEGHKIRIEAPRNCDSLSCIKISAPSLSGSSFGNFGGSKSKNDDDDVASDPAPAKSTPAPTPAPAPGQATAPQPAPVTTTAPAQTVVASTAPAANDVAPSPPAPAAVAPPAPQPAPVAAAPAPAPAPTTPLGVWATEENKGNVRIEECGKNLCGYAVKTGEKILINMRPTDSKWTGRIHDPNSGRDYESTMAMKGTNTLRVQGCAFGGMFCGGQTWKRVS